MELKRKQNSHDLPSLERRFGFSAHRITERHYSSFFGSQNLVDNLSGVTQNMVGFEMRHTKNGTVGAPTSKIETRSFHR